MSGCSLSAGRTNSWPSGRIPYIEKLHCTVGLPSDHGRVRTFCQPDYRSHKMDRNIRGSKWPSGQGTRRRDLPAHLNETFIPVYVPTKADQISADLAALHESASGTSRHFAAPQHLGRFRSEADIERLLCAWRKLGPRLIVALSTAPFAHRTAIGTCRPVRR